MIYCKKKEGKKGGSRIRKFFPFIPTACDVVRASVKHHYPRNGSFFFSPAVTMSLFDDFLESTEASAAEARSTVALNKHEQHANNASRPAKSAKVRWLLKYTISC